MSVAEMRRSLGLGKTDSYWLVHHGFFETILVNGKMRVVIDSFESWYAMQTRHRKVTGEEPGARLREETLSAGEIAELLGISKQQANVLIRQEELPFFKVHCQFQVPKDAFERWYASQTRYVKRQERDAFLSDRYMHVPKMARRLGVGRNTVYSIPINKELQRVNRETLKLLGSKGVIFIFPSQSSLTSTQQVLKSPKTESSIRKVFLPKTVAEMLAQTRKKQLEVIDALDDEYKDFNLVIAGPLGMPIEARRINGAFDKLIQKNSLPKVVFLSLRHSSITYKLKLNGGDIKAVQGDSGHA